MVKLVAGDNTIECKLVVFDKDATLVDQHKLLLELAKARRNGLRRLAGEKDAQMWERMVGVDVESGKIDHGGPLGTAPRHQELLVASAALYLGGHSWSEARDLTQKAYDEADHSMKPPYGSILLEGVPDKLRQLKQSGLKLAVSSNDTHRRIRESFKALQIDSLFDAIIGSDDVVNQKPSPDMLIKALEETGSRADEAVMIGDSMRDIQMGRNADVKACIGVLTGFTSQAKLEELADVVVPSVASLRVL